MIPSLRAFLTAQNLGQYYDAFLEAGATDNDLPQLLRFNDDELNEFISAIHMPLFPALNLKRSLRELRHQQCVLSPSSSSSATTDPSRQVIIQHATVYGKKKNRPLTSYEKAINDAAIQLALDDPSLLSQPKARLFELAKQRLLDTGYQYKRGKSRSKLLSTTTTATTTNKRQLNAQRTSEERQRKIRELQERLQLIQERQRQYPEELLQLEQARSELAKEISKLKAQERKHQWYEKRKTERVDSGFSESASDVRARTLEELLS